MSGTPPNHIITSSNHSFDSFKKMKTLRENQSLCDVNIKIGETSIAAHKVILASCSPYFEFMFTGKVTENGKTDIELKDLRPEDVSALIEYVYSGVLVVNDETIFNILKTADFLKITSAKEECLKFLQKNINALNCIAIRDLAKKHFFTGLENKVNYYIRWNFHQVIRSEAFLKFTLNKVKGFLSDSCFCLINSSFEEAVSAWIQYDTSREGFKDELSTTVIGLTRSLLQGELDLYDPHLQKRIYLFDESGNTNVIFFDLNNYALHEAPRRPDLCSFSCVCVKNAIYLIDTSRGTYCQYDSEEEKWATTKMTSATRFYSRACNVQDSIFLVADGELKKTFNFDVETNVLHEKPSLLYQRTYPGVAFHGNCVYVCGGGCYSAERHDIRTKLWRSIAMMPDYIGKTSAASLGDYIYCADVEKQQLYKYDIRNGKWTTMATIPKTGDGSPTPTAISCSDDTLYAVNRKGIYQYSHRENTWTTACSLKHGPILPTCLYYVPQ